MTDTVYVATREFITAHTDILADQPFIGTLKAGIRYERSIIGSGGFGGLTLSWGEVSLYNLERDHDSLLTTQTVDGEEIVIKVTELGESYDSAITIAQLVGAGAYANDEHEVVIRVRDPSYRLRVAAQPVLFQGTGDLEGGTDLQGKRKPLLFGRAHNLSPALVIASELVFMISYRGIQEVEAVYDSGSALTGPAADYATSALLRAASIAAGAFATCLAEGLFRVGSPFAQITCDAKGDNDGGYVNTTGTIVRRLLSIATDLTDPGDLLVHAFEDLETLQPAVVGYYLDPESSLNVDDVIAHLMGGIGGWGGFDVIGEAKFGVNILVAPSGTSTANYDEVDVLSISRDRLPDSVDPPPWRWRVAYERNWTQIATPVAGVVQDDPDRAAWLNKPYKVAATPDSDGATILANYPSAQDPAVTEAYFDEEADALAEASRRLLLYSQGYTLTRVELKVQPFLHNIGECVTLTYPIWNLTDGRKMRIVGLSDDGDQNQIGATLFG